MYTQSTSIGSAIHMQCNTYTQTTLFIKLKAKVERYQFGVCVFVFVSWTLCVSDIEENWLDDNNDESELNRNGEKQTLYCLHNMYDCIGAIRKS